MIMKPALILILIFISAQYYAQSGKDSLLLKRKEHLNGLNSDGEKKDTSHLRMKQFLLFNNIITYTTDLKYIADLPKRQLKEELEKIALTPRQLAEQNLKNIMKEIRVETEDKRSWFQKFFEDFLGIAKWVAVAALALKTLIK